MHTKSKIDKIIHSDLKCLKGLPIEVIVSIIIQITIVILIVVKLRLEK